jgi:hypothetical protein
LVWTLGLSRTLDKSQMLYLPVEVADKVEGMAEDMEVGKVADMV